MGQVETARKQADATLAKAKEEAKRAARSFADSK
jgi:hypothetical protein